MFGCRQSSLSFLRINLSWCNILHNRYCKFGSYCLLSRPGGLFSAFTEDMKHFGWLLLWTSLPFRAWNGPPTTRGASLQNSLFHWPRYEGHWSDGSGLSRIPVSTVRHPTKAWSVCRTIWGGSGIVRISTNDADVSSSHLCYRNCCHLSALNCKMFVIWLDISIHQWIHIKRR